MQAKIQNTPLVYCNYTGATLRPALEPIFKCPPKKKNGPWTNNFADPGCVIAYIDQLCVNGAINTTQKADMLEALRDSLKCATTDIEVNVTKPPHPSSAIYLFGGSMSHQEYFATYNHDLQVKNLTQLEPLRPKNRTQLSKTSYRKIEIEQKKIVSVDASQEMPKNIKAVLSYLAAMVDGAHFAVTVGSAETGQLRFCVWNPLDINDTHCSVAEAELGGPPRSVPVPKCYLFMKQKTMAEKRQATKERAAAKRAKIKKEKEDTPMEIGI